MMFRVGMMIVVGGGFFCFRFFSAGFRSLMSWGICRDSMLVVWRARWSVRVRCAVSFWIFLIRYCCVFFSVTSFLVVWLRCARYLRSRFVCFGVRSVFFWSFSIIVCRRWSKFESFCRDSALSVFVHCCLLFCISRVRVV